MHARSTAGQLNAALRFVIREARMASIISVIDVAVPFSLIYIRIFTFLCSECLSKAKPKLFVYLDCINCGFSSFSSLMWCRCKAEPQSKATTKLKCHQSSVSVKQKRIGQKNRLKYLIIHQELKMRRSYALSLLFDSMPSSKRRNGMHACRRWWKERNKNAADKTNKEAIDKLARV